MVATFSTDFEKIEKFDRCDCQIYPNLVNACQCFCTCEVCLPITSYYVIVLIYSPSRESVDLTPLVHDPQVVELLEPLLERLHAVEVRLSASLRDLSRVRREHTIEIVSNTTTQ